jgi:hypothetical protein
VFGFGLPTGGKGHGGDEEDLLCCAKRSREACADFVLGLVRILGENADPALWRYLLALRSAQERLPLMYLLACFGFFGRSQLRGASVVSFRMLDENGMFYQAH